MISSHLPKLIAGKLLYGVICLSAAVLLVVAGYAHKVVGQVAATGKGVTIPGSPSVGAMNILVMGLESRTDYEGQTLPNSLLTAMHAGSASAVSAGQVGSQDTNTLILIHIFAGGKKAVGFSISRDDLVTYPQAYDGQTEGKIDGAYAYAYVQYLNENTGKESSKDLYLHANQAGQAATIATVQSVTGQHVDHFVEVNLAGFYYLASAFNGIEVCIQPAPAQGGFAAGANLTDFVPSTGTNNSGFNAFKDGYNSKKGGKQYLHLAAAQSLAYVRARDTLPGVDLGRTKRQQAVIDYVIYELKHEGVFADLAKLNSLLGTASTYLITDSGFNLLDFATDMRALNGQDLSFQTLPYTPENNVPVPGYPAPQDVNIIDVPYIQRLVKSAFDPQSAATGAKTATKATASPSVSVPAASVTVDVYNGDPTAVGLAAQVSQGLVGLGYKAGKIENSTAQTRTVQPGTQIFYGAGAAGNAQQIALQFGATATALSTLPADHVEVLIGSTVTTVPAGITPTSAATAGPQSTGAQVIGSRTATGPTTTPTPTSTAGTGSSGTGGSVTVAPNAPYGVPCVY
ncbi:MAG: transcription regulator, LytR family [Actinomycetia bacterium]|nr:transcription regulator, LytR family [Actinomycetes bacterium]